MLAFEQPIVDLEEKIRDMRSYAETQSMDLTEEVNLLERRLERLKKETFDNLTRWQRVQVARAPGRPTGLDYIDAVFTDFQELHGDRTLGDDPALVAGLARLGEQSVVVMVQQKGRDTKENIGQTGQQGQGRAEQRQIARVRNREQAGHHRRRGEIGAPAARDRTCNGQPGHLFEEKDVEAAPEQPNGGDASDAAQKAIFLNAEINERPRRDRQQDGTVEDAAQTL